MGTANTMLRTAVPELLKVLTVEEERLELGKENPVF